MSPTNWLTVFVFLVAIVFGAPFVAIVGYLLYRILTGF